jgi:hypothetical protein
MESEQIQIELIEVVDKAINGENAWQGLRNLMLILKNEDSDIILNALLEIFFEDDLFQYQCAAGGLLWKLKPKYNRNLPNDIRRTLQGWDVSIEELPWYFAEAIGIEKVKSVVESLLAEPLEEIERKRAETYLYWLTVSSADEFRRILNQGWNGRLRG